MKRAYALALCLAAVGAHAATPPDLPPQDVVARWLAQDPAVREAAAQRAAADQVAAQRRLSPNEWTLETGVQQRRYDSDARVREWNLGLERTVRLPGKRRLDAALGERGMDAAQARYDAAVRAALLDLCDLWLDWAMAGELAALAARQADLASANRAAVERRVTAGDAARLDLALADADRDDAERLRREADAEAAIARARLAARFADLPAAPPSLSPPPSQHAAAPQRIAQWLAASADLRVAAAERDEAVAAVARESAERRPDPTIGVFNAAEGSGSERIVGLSLRVPLPGRYRAASLARAVAERDQREAALSRVMQQSHAAAQALVIADDSAMQRWELADAAVRRTEDSVRLTQRAYALGETDLQTLLLARRQAVDAARTRASTQALALRAHYRWAIGAGSLWAEVARGDDARERGTAGAGDG